MGAAASIALPNGAEPARGPVGRTCFGRLLVWLFCLPPGLRGQGAGEEPLSRAEGEARARGRVGVRLDAFGFQARGLYEKRGRALLSALPARPLGHARLFAAKRLDTAPPAA